jgi:sporulation protein YlmC with PRC-barrel domain
MIVKTAVVALALACSLDGAALAASTAPPAMATGHVGALAGAANKPGVTEAADQLPARKIIGASVREENGQQIASIVDLIIDRRRDAVVLAVLKPGGSAAYKGGPTRVAWSSLSFQPTPTPRFATALGPQALAAGTPLKQRIRGNPAYYDVKKDLLGKKVVGAHGAKLGNIRDVILNDRSGRLVALVINTAGLIDIGAHYHAIAWNRAEPHGRHPVRIALSKQQVDAAPVTNTMTPLPVPTHATGAVPAVIHRNQTGNLSGTSVPGPATRR